LFAGLDGIPTPIFVEIPTSIMDASESLVLKSQFHSFVALAVIAPSSAFLELSLAASPLPVSVGTTISSLLVEDKFAFLTSIVGFALVNGIIGAASSTLSSKLRIVLTNDSSLAGTSLSRSSCKYK